DFAVADFDGVQGRMLSMRPASGEKHRCRAPGRLLSRWVPFENGRGADRERGIGVSDRKSTRLNSSHSQISYAVFCLKKKKENFMFIKTAQFTVHVVTITEGKISDVSAQILIKLPPLTVTADTMNYRDDAFNGKENVA